MGRDISLPFCMRETAWPELTSLLEDAIHNEEDRRAWSCKTLDGIEDSQRITLNHNIPDAYVKSETQANLHCFGLRYAYDKSVKHVECVMPEDVGSVWHKNQGKLLTTWGRFINGLSFTEKNHWPWWQVGRASCAFYSPES